MCYSLLPQSHTLVFHCILCSFGAFLDNSFLSAMEIIPSHRCIVKMVYLPFWTKLQVCNEKRSYKKAVFLHH